MTLRKTTYRKLPRQGESVGITHVEHPVAVFWNEIRRDFLLNTIRASVHGVQIPNLEDLLDELGFGPGTFSLDEWFQHYQPPVAPLPRDAATLKKSSEAAEDLAKDDGLWKADAADLDRPEKDALVEIHHRLTRMKQHVATKFGPKAVVEVSEQIRRRFKAASEHWDHRLLPGRVIEELQHAGVQLRSYSVPRQWYLKLLMRFHPGLSSRWWLSESQFRNTERRLFPLIKEATRLRFDQELQRRKRRVGEVLLGRPGVKGLLDEVHNDADGETEFFHQLSAAAESIRSDVDSRNPAAILTAESIDTVIGPAGRSLRHLYNEALQSAGCSPKELADRLIASGLVINGRAYKPAQWRELDLPTVLAALIGEVDEYLGTEDFDKPFSNTDELRTAFQFARAITPLHKELEPLVKNLIPKWVQRSKPYAEVQDLVGAEPHNHALLYCFPADRPKWEQLLQTSITLVNSSKSAADTEAYALDRPHTVTLIQFGLAMPLGGLKSLSSWMHQRVLVQRHGNSQPLFNLPASPEIRLVSERPNDYDACQTLFGVACKAQVFVPVGESPNPSRYTLATVDPQFEPLFAPDTFEPDWKTGEYFHGKLQDPVFIRCLEIAFPTAQPSSLPDNTGRRSALQTI